MIHTVDEAASWVDGQTATRCGILGVEEEDLDWAEAYLAGRADDAPYVTPEGLCHLYCRANTPMPEGLWHALGSRTR